MASFEDSDPASEEPTGTGPHFLPFSTATADNWEKLRTKLPSHLKRSICFHSSTSVWTTVPGPSTWHDTVLPYLTPLNAPLRIANAPLVLPAPGIRYHCFTIDPSQQPSDDPLGIPPNQTLLDPTVQLSDELVDLFFQVFPCAQGLVVLFSGVLLVVFDEYNHVGGRVDLHESLMRYPLTFGGLVIRGCYARRRRLVESQKWCHARETTRRIRDRVYFGGLLVACIPAIPFLMLGAVLPMPKFLSWFQKKEDTPPRTRPRTVRWPWCDTFPVPTTSTVVDVQSLLVNQMLQFETPGKEALAAVSIGECIMRKNGHRYPRHWGGEPIAPGDFTRTLLLRAQAEVGEERSVRVAGEGKVVGMVERVWYEGWEYPFYEMERVLDSDVDGSDGASMHTSPVNPITGVDAMFK